MACCVRWRSDRTGRAVVTAFVVCLLMAFGRTTFGPLVAIIPASGDIFFRRFLMGAQLAGLLLAGMGAGLIGRTLWALLTRYFPAVGAKDLQDRTGKFIAVFLILVLGVVALIPALAQFRSYDADLTAQVSYQEQADSTQGQQVDSLAAFVARSNNGRVYAGMPSNWGPAFTVGEVPVFKYLESRHVDEVGDTLRTESLMTDPEYYFDENNPGDYPLFGIRYLILRTGTKPPVPAQRVMVRGQYSLWTIPNVSYIQVGTVVGRITREPNQPGNAKYSSLAFEAASAL